MVRDKDLIRDKKKLLPGSGMSYHKFKKPDYKILQTFDSPAQTVVSKVVFKTNEISALCPLTGQPDWYKISITYIPKKKCIESKSAKLYFGAYRDYPAFIETLAEMIFNDWMQACNPESLSVVLEMAPRGGIAIEVIKEI